MKIRRRFFATSLLWLWCLSAASSFAASAETDNNGLEIGINRIGTDLRRIRLGAAEPMLCRSACFATSACTAFTYIKPKQANATRATCVLKKAATTVNRDDCCISGLRPEPPEALLQSPLYQSLLAYEEKGISRLSADGRHDTLAEYARKCDEATGIPVPDFTCDAPDAKSPEGQDRGGDGKCDKPNVLERRCDPGSKFQILPGRTADAVAVAHCRKGVSRPGEFHDIAVIQYNKKNGATCFYQALGVLPGNNVPAPIKNIAWIDGVQHWMTPTDTEERVSCTRCHDNGGFLRSPYLAKLIPNTADGYDNLNTPVRYVGLDYKTNKSWSIEVANAPGDTGTPCYACHRLAVNNSGRTSSGTAVDLAIRATAATQEAKNPHSATSPIWMRPGQIFHSPATQATAQKYKQCAEGFVASNFTVPPAGCTIKPLAEAWVPPPPPPPPPTPRELCLADCQADLADCMDDAKKPGGPLPRWCLATFRACKAACPP